MKKLVVVAALTIGIFGAIFTGSKMTSHAAVIFDDEAFEEEYEEASEVAEETVEETSEEASTDEPEIEIFIDVEDPTIEEESDVPAEENKKGLIPENETPESVEEQEETKAKGLIPEETAGEVKGSVVPVSDNEVVEVKHEGVKPMDTNTTEDGKTAFCIEEQEQHPDYSGTDYVVVDNTADVNKYDHIVVGYTEAVNRGENKTLCDRAAQAAIWDLNGSQDDQEALLADSHEGQEKDDVIRLYNEFKNHEAVDHSKWKINYTTLAPVETSEFGNYQNLICFEATEIKEDKPENPPKKEEEKKPEETPEFYPLEEDVPETGDSHLPVAPFAAIGLLSAIAIVGVTCKRNAR